MIRLYPGNLKTSLRPPCPSLASTFFRSRYATRAGLRAPQARLPSKALPPRVAKPSSKRVDPAAVRHQFRADQIYDRGVRNVYTAPSHAGMLGFSWALGTLALSYTVWLGIEGHWDMRDRMTGWQKTITESGNRLGMIFFGFVGWYALIRYTGLIKSIDLVQRGGMARLSLKVRRLVPIVPPREIILPVTDLNISPYWLHQVDDLSLERGDLRRRGWTFNLRKLFWLSFVKFRSWVFRHGIIHVNYRNNSKRLLLDLAGDFSNRGADLWDLTHTGRSGPSMR